MAQSGSETRIVQIMPAAADWWAAFVNVSREDVSHLVVTQPLVGWALMQDGDGFTWVVGLASSPDGVVEGCARRGHLGYLAPGQDALLLYRRAAEEYRRDLGLPVAHAVIRRAGVPGGQVEPRRAAAAGPRLRNGRSIDPPADGGTTLY